MVMAGAQIVRFAMLGRLIRLASVLFFGALIIAPFNASHAEAPSPEAITTARELLAVMGEKATITSTMRRSLGELRAAALKRTPEKATEIAAFWDDLQERLEDDVPELIDTMAPAYATRFSVAEMKGLIEFYRTPTGRALLANQEFLSRMSVTATLNWMTRALKKVDRR